VVERARGVADVSRLVVGTAAIGLPYGLPRAGESAPRLMDDADATALIRAAEVAGIGAFDTAPAYGVAEARLGAAISPRARVWTKVSAAPDSPGDLATSLRSLADSLGALRRPQIDLLQWHNWTGVLGAASGSFPGHWRALGQDPRVAALGATTYGREDALAAVTSGLFRVVQVEWNLLNQGVVAYIAEAARSRNVSIAVRSVFLQGVLTDRGERLPPHLAGLEQARARAQSMARKWGIGLHALALRAALDHPAVRWVLIGLDGREQLDQALAVAAMAPLSGMQRQELAQLDLGGDAITDPRTWSRT
jgi:aryl-alcohol dehydrogenase-like predicted oxidoreductase